MVQAGSGRWKLYCEAAALPWLWLKHTAAARPRGAAPSRQQCAHPKPALWRASPVVAPPIRRRFGRAVRSGPPCPQLHPVGCTEEESL